MAFTLEPLTEIDDIIFDDVWNSSLPHMNNGSTDWDLVASKGFQVTTDEDKKIFIKTRIQNAIDNQDGIHYASLIKMDGYTVFYMMSRTINGVFGIPIFLPRPDINGSKAYVYSVEFRDQLRLHALSINGGSLNASFPTPNSDTNTMKKYISTFNLHPNAVRTDEGIQDITNENVFSLQLGTD